MRQRTLWVIAATSFLAFLILAVAVKVSPDLVNWDMQAALWANHLSPGGFVNSLLVDASLYGREYFWVALVALLFLLGDRRTKLVALGLAGVFVVGIVAGTLAKELVARPRPFEDLVRLLQGSFVVRIPLDTDYSFPSGHALIVSIGAAYSLLTFRRKWVAGLLAVEAAVVCFSRVYTFEHFPTDVFGGVLLGTAIAASGLALGRTRLRKQADMAANYLVKLFRNGFLKV